MDPLVFALIILAQVCVLLAWASLLLRRGADDAHRWPSPRNYAFAATLSLGLMIILSIAFDVKLLRMLPSAALWTVALMIPIHWVALAIRRHRSRPESFVQD